MKYIFAIIFSLLLSVFSLKEVKPKLCINCKYYLKNIVDGRSEYGKCDFEFLVNGIRIQKPIEYHYCSTAREFTDMCDKEGKMHVRKYEKNKSRNKEEWCNRYYNNK